MAPGERKETTIRGERVLVGVLVLGAKAGMLLGFAAGFCTAAAIAWWVA